MISPTKIVVGISFAGPRPIFILSNSSRDLGSRLSSLPGSGVGSGAGSVWLIRLRSVWPKRVLSGLRGSGTEKRGVAAMTRTVHAFTQGPYTVLFNRIFQGWVGFRFRLNPTARMSLPRSEPSDGVTHPCEDGQEAAKSTTAVCGPLILIR